MVYLIRIWNTRLNSEVILYSLYANNNAHKNVIGTHILLLSSESYKIGKTI